MTAAVRAYAYDNDSAQATSHHDALSGLLDEFSKGRITGLLDLSGKRCLEVAAGGGGIARWLAGEVGSAGEVIATDIKPQHIPPHDQMTVIQHDITADPIPGTFDFIHARLLLNHLHQREEVLTKFVAALNPGGVLLTEDFNPHEPDKIVAYAKDPADAALYARYHQIHNDILTRHRNSRSWAKRALSAHTEAGLVDVETQVYGRSWRGGSNGSQLMRASLDQLHDEVIELGMTEADIVRLRELLADREFVLHGHPVFSTSGRRGVGLD